MYMCATYREFKLWAIHIYIYIYIYLNYVYIICLFLHISQVATCNKKTRTDNINKNYYKWAKWTEFLLAVIYGSPRRHSLSYNTFKKNGKTEIIFMTISRLAESFKTMNRPLPARPDGSALWRLISQKVYKIGM